MTVYAPVHKAVPGRPFLTFLRYNLPYWRAYLAGAVLSLFFVVIGLVSPFVIRSVVARFRDQTITGNQLGLYFAALTGIAVVTGVARYYQRVLMIGASRDFEYDLRNDYFRHVQLLSQEFFHRMQTGDIMARATNDLNYVRLFIGPGIMGTVDLSRVVFTVWVMFYFSVKLTVIVLLPLPIMSVIVYLLVMYMHRQSERVQASFSELSARAQENLAGARVVKAYGIEDRELRTFEAQSSRYLRENVKLAAVMSSLWPAVGLIAGVTMLLVLWYGGQMVIAGEMLLEDFSAFLVLLFMVSWPLAQFGWVLTLYQRGAVSMNRVAEVLAEEPRIRDRASVRRDITTINGAIEFRNVTFGYGGRAVLNDVNVRVEPGQTLAIVGSTGSGKSSMVALLTREFDPTSGEVLIDGVDAREIPLAVLRGAIGYVPQETVLFSDSVRANLTFGKPGATEEEIAHACRVAQFDEVVASLDKGYDSLLGERGVNLSGGQKQRLAIARAVICDPAILVLDDALSSVDTQTESRVLAHLKSVMASRTSVIIAHRVSAVQHADLILAIDNGRIVEQGRHEELVQRGGFYARMYERQLLEEELEREP